MRVQRSAVHELVDNFTGNRTVNHTVDQTTDVHELAGNSAKYTTGHSATPTPWDTWRFFNMNGHCRKILNRTESRCFANQHEVYTSAFCNTSGLLYVRNSKANSKGIWEHMNETCSGLLMPGENTYVAVEIDAGCLPYGFTFVREPFERTVSSYGEVDAKANRHHDCNVTLHDSDATFHRIPRKDEPQRFEAFLEDFSAHRIPEVCAPSHANPQAYNLCKHQPVLRAIGRLEVYEEHLKRIENAARGTHSDKCRRATETTAFDGSQPSGLTYAEVKTIDNDAVLLAATDKTRLKVCELFLVDYVCFGYELPSPCGRLLSSEYNDIPLFESRI